MVKICTFIGSLKIEKLNDALRRNKMIIHGNIFFYKILAVKYKYFVKALCCYKLYNASVLYF